MKLELAKIQIDGGTQARAALNEDVVAEYAEAIIGGADMPPITVFQDGKKYWLADGFHRYHAHVKALAVEIEAEIFVGTRRTAILHSVQANAHHGLRRTNDDKRCAVRTLLDDKEWGAWSDREIAKRCSVSVSFVGAMRNPEVAQRQQEHRSASATRKGVVGLHPDSASSVESDSTSNSVPASKPHSDKGSAPDSAAHTTRLAFVQPPADGHSPELNGKPITGVVDERADDADPGINDLQEQLEQSRQNAEELAEIVESYSKLEEGEHVFAKEMARLKGQLRTIESQRNGYMTTCNELKRTVKALQRENDRLKKKVGDAK